MILRRKRWDYWCVTSDECVFAVTLADVDYLGLVVVSHLDLATGRWTEKAVPLPFALGLRLPESLRGADIGWSGLGLAVTVAERGDATHLTVASSKIVADLHVDRTAEALTIDARWNERHHQRNTKAFAMPVRGSVTCKGRRHDMDGGFACLDFGRGVWPYRTRWFWACAAGVRDGRAVGINLGGEWTRGTGVTENGLLVGGRLTKLDHEVLFQRGDVWRIDGPGVELAFSPRTGRTVGANLGILASRLDWAYGTFSGSIAGEAIADLPGWAEEHRARW
jgi:uncharacterized protein DUF2804